MSRFLKDFIWGAATSAYQIEGAAYEDGKGKSIWDTFCQVPGAVVNGDHGEVACDHYHRFQEDIAIMKNLNIQSYRFSVSWPRIFPNGSGQANAKGIDFYKRLVDEILKQGMDPMLTLYHWDLPQALQDRGGWVSRDTAMRFAEYSSYLYDQLGDVVKNWVTVNEPWVVSYLGHYTGEHAPGMKDLTAFLKSAHHVLLGHGESVQRFRESKAKDGKIGIVLNMTTAYAASDSEEDMKAASFWDGLLNRWFMDPVFKGAYPEDMMEIYGRSADFDFIQPGDLDVIAQRTDFLGINYYSVSHLKAGTNEFGIEHVSKPGAPVTDMGWEIEPQGLYVLLHRLHHELNGLPIVITENGAAYDDAVDEQGAVIDDARLQYVQAHIGVCLRALSEGVHVKGYYLWSLLDNFEWAFGYGKRFGMVHVDFNTLERTPKKSAYWYGEFIKKQMESANFSAVSEK